MTRSGRLIGILAAACGLVVMIAVGAPVVDWWHHWIADRSRPVGNHSGSRSPTGSSSPQPTALTFSVLTTPQQPTDRPPTWTRLDRTSVQTARLIAVSTGTRVYLTGSNTSGCTIIVDLLDHDSGSGCGGRSMKTLWTGSSNTADPCGIVAILIPDGYSSIKSSPALHVIANGRNAMLVTSPRRAVDVTVTGNGRVPLSLGNIGGPFSQPPPQATNC